MIRKSHGALWVDLFFSYLGPFYAATTCQFALRRGMIYVRRGPVDWLAAREVRIERLLAALDVDWKKIPYGILKKVSRRFATDTGGLGENILFSLLFSETDPGPRRWNSRWEKLVSAPETPMPDSVDREDLPVAFLVPEATPRNELGRSPNGDRRPRRRKTN